jgi:TFIIF-interacting CTD phosphatase-like protein
MSKINLVLDLDNTLISSISFREMKRLKNLDKRKLKYKVMHKDYRVYYRPYLAEFLEYAFANFHVTVWTAASRDYAAFIIDNILIDEKPVTSSVHDPRYIKTNIRGRVIPRQLKMFLYDENCDQSQKFFDKDSPKDLRYLHNFEGYRPCNTIIMDDLPEVYDANPKHTLRAPYFDAKKEESEEDTFLLEAIEKLKEIKKKFDVEGCPSHNH